MGHADKLYQQVMKELWDTVLAKNETKSLEWKAFLCLYKGYCCRKFASFSFIHEMLTLALERVLKLKSCPQFVLLCQGVWMFCDNAIARKVENVVISMRRLMMK
jgi:hypothetical protein